MKSFPKDMPEWQAIQNEYNAQNAPYEGNVPYATGPAQQDEILPNNFMPVAQAEANEQAAPMTEAEMDNEFGPGVVASGQISQADFDKIRGQAPAPAFTPPPSKEESLLEEYRKMREQDQKDLESARSSDRNLKIGGAIGDALATVLNARGQMNVKAPGVQVQQGAGLGKIADMFQTAPQKAEDIKSRRDDLMAQYRALKGSGEMTPYQESALKLQRERLGLQKQQEEGKSERHGQSLEFNRDKAGQLSDKVATSFADMETAKKEAARLLPRVKDAGLGLLGTPYQKTRAAMGIPSKEFQGLESDYAGIRNTIRNAMFGSALTAPEIDAFEKELNDISVSQSGFENNLTNFMDRVQRKMSEKAKAMAKGQPLKEKALQPFMQSSKAADPKIQKYADDHGLDYSKAETILRNRGYNG